LERKWYDLKILEFLSPLWDTVKGVLPLTLMLTFLQTVVLRKTIESPKEFFAGIVFTILGLHFFLKGANMSLISLSDSVGRNIHVLNNRWLIILIGFIIGYLGTLVEPALKVLAQQAEDLSVGAIKSQMLVHGVAAGFGLGLALGLYRIMSGTPFLKLLVPLLLLVVALSFFTPEPFDALAIDSASATTGPVNIPINMAIAIGLASVIKGADPLISGFGVVGLTSLGAMVSVMILGIITRF
jgi:hypothetical protein